MKIFKHISVLTTLFVCIGTTACNDNEEPIEVTVTSQQEIDLGLSVNWAGWNIGANSPEECGDYYAWGETKPKSIYYWSSYKLNFDDLISIGKVETKIVNDSIETDTITITKTHKEYMQSINWTLTDTIVLKGNIATDIAKVQWKDGWRMPTKDEINELIEGCKWTWCTYKGITGYKVEGANGNSIFLPTTGCYNGPSLNNKGKFGLYWSSQKSKYEKEAYCLTIGLKDENRFYDYTVNIFDFKLGFCVRPVKDKIK